MLTIIRCENIEASNQIVTGFCVQTSFWTRLLPHHYILLSRPVTNKFELSQKGVEQKGSGEDHCLQLMVPVTITACCTTMAFPSAWHSLVLSLPSIAVTCVLKAVISTLCSIAAVSFPSLYFSQFSQACGCLSVEVDSPVIWFSCLPPCCSATAFWLLRDILLSISALATPISYSASCSLFCSI